MLPPSSTPWPSFELPDPYSPFLFPQSFSHSPSPRSLSRHLLCSHPYQFCLSMNLKNTVFRVLRHTVSADKMRFQDSARVRPNANRKREEGKNKRREREAKEGHKAGGQTIAKITTASRCNHSHRQLLQIYNYNYSHSYIQPQPLTTTTLTTRSLSICLSPTLSTIIAL